MKKRIQKEKEYNYIVTVSFSQSVEANNEKEAREQLKETAAALGEH